MLQRLLSHLLFALLLATCAVPAAWAKTGAPPEQSTHSQQPRNAAADQTASIDVAQLPAEARGTLSLIKRGGPFPYLKDGSIFGNRERALPRRERGYYREYTVRTPGARDRGARRIIAGAGGEYYYTSDHYRSF